MADRRHHNNRSRTKASSPKASATSSGFPPAHGEPPVRHVLLSKDCSLPGPAGHKTPLPPPKNPEALVAKSSSALSAAIEGAATVIHFADVPQVSGIILNSEGATVLPYKKHAVLSPSLLGTPPSPGSLGPKEPLQTPAVALTSSSQPVTLQRVSVAELLRGSVVVADLEVSDEDAGLEETACSNTVGPSAFTEGHEEIASASSGESVCSERQPTTPVHVGCSEALPCLMETESASTPHLIMPGIGAIQDHSYGMASCPDLIRRTLEGKLESEKKKNEEHKHKIKILKQKLKRKEQKIVHLLNVIKQLQKKIGHAVNDMNIELTDCSFQYMNSQ
nr:PREDICTED: uncharacterized protein LOC106704418 [Latimeria chalumnae]|eukprot:XP_014346923.1 PREDICTED: uncharacterized protein LOC106704418 [Latimeria chalumnae]